MDGQLCGEPWDSPNPAQARLAVQRGDYEKDVRECNLSGDDCMVLLALILVKISQAGIRITCKISNRNGKSYCDQSR
jgi:hypothetical protein